MLTTPAKKVKQTQPQQTPHETRLRKSLDRQVSLQDRMDKVRAVVEDEAPRD